MAKRRKRRSQAILTERAMKDIRNLHRDHLKQISAILTNVLGFPVKVSIVKTAEVSESVRKPKRGKVQRQVAHVAGYHEDAPAEYECAARTVHLAADEVGI